LSTHTFYVIHTPVICFAPRNGDGGSVPIEENSIGAYSKIGHSPATNLSNPIEALPQPVFYLSDVVADGHPMFGSPKSNNNAEISELMSSCGRHIILFSTGRRGSAISVLKKICANPDIYQRMNDDMDINADRILTNEATLEDIADENIEKIEIVASGAATCSEELGHREFVLSYKRSEPIGSACLL
jgi:altronate dehydratase large subunit